MAVTSGANMNIERLRLVTELAGIGALKEAMLATTMPERQGSFKDFLDIALDSDSDLQITEFKYRCAPWALMIWNLGFGSKHWGAVHALMHKTSSAPCI